MCTRFQLLLPICDQVFLTVALGEVFPGFLLVVLARHNVQGSSCVLVSILVLDTACVLLDCGNYFHNFVISLVVRGTRVPTRLICL